MEVVRSFRSDDGKLYETIQKAVAADIAHAVFKLSSDRDLDLREGAAYMAANHKLFIDLLHQLD